MPSKTLLSILVMLAGLLALSVPCGAQLQRHALLEEGTGGWCEWCAYADYTIDSMQAHLGDSLVVLEWHGPLGYSEPLWIPAMDSVTQSVGALAFPWLSAGRERVNRQVYLSTTFPNSSDSLVRSKAESPADVSFAFKSANYIKPTREVRVTLSIDPNPGIATEDTITYYVVTVIAEDSIVAPQERAAAPGFTKASIPDFVHNNVVRAVGGSALGDSIDLGTLDASPHSADVEYDFSIDPDWRLDKCRVKAILFRRSKKSGVSRYIDAVQTGYVTTLPPLGVTEPHVTGAAHFPTPNPATAFVRIPIDYGVTGLMRIVVTAADGKWIDVKWERSEGSVLVDTRQLSPGSYHFAVRNGNQAPLTGWFEVVR